jgi:D-glycero-beta-D-manno-heptose-7-phosphate kinase
MQFQSLQEIFDSFNRITALIIGDVMIDSYVYGKTERISPEAPVPVVSVQRREKRLGGAANVALNVQALGANPILCSIIGDEPEGDLFFQLLKERGISNEGVIRSKNRLTTIKERILAGSQQLIRVDSESVNDLDLLEEKALLQHIKALMKKADVVIFEDYDKGTLNERIISETIKYANEIGLPTVVDPKKKNFHFYKNSTLFKPNFKELKEGLNIELSADEFEKIKKAADDLKEKLAVKQILVTLSEHGLLVSGENEKHLIPAHLRRISDVSGAGDTVISITALCVAIGLPLKLVGELANLGGGLVCEFLGVIPINKEMLLDEAKKYTILD